MQDTLIPNSELQKSRIQELRRAIYTISQDNEKLFKKLDEYERFRNESLDHIDLFYDPSSLFSSDSDYYSSDDELINEPSDSDSAEFFDSKASKVKAKKNRANLNTEHIGSKPTKPKNTPKPAPQINPQPFQAPQTQFPPYSPLFLLSFYKFNVDLKKLYSDYLLTFKNDPSDNQSIIPFTEKEYNAILLKSPLMRSLVEKIISKKMNMDQIAGEIKKMQIAMATFNPANNTLPTVPFGTPLSKSTQPAISQQPQIAQPKPAIRPQQTFLSSSIQKTENQRPTQSELKAQLEAKLSQYSTSQLYDYILHLDSKSLVVVLMKLPATYRNALLPKLSKEQLIAYENHIAAQSSTGQNEPPPVVNKQQAAEQQPAHTDEEIQSLRYLSTLPPEKWMMLKNNYKPSEYEALVKAVNAYRQQTKL